MNLDVFNGTLFLAITRSSNGLLDTLEWIFNQTYIYVPPTYIGGTFGGTILLRTTYVV